jgi:hypothetical protein
MTKAMPIVWVVLSLLALCAAARGTPAQTSTNYQNKEHTVNAGGNPAPTLTSTNYSVTLSNIGEGMPRAGMSSAGYSMEGGLPECHRRTANQLFHELGVFRSKRTCKSTRG